LVTTVTEIASDIFRLCNYDQALGMQFNQFLVRDEEPLLYHTWNRATFPVVRDAIAQVLDPATLRWISFSHFEADECGALNDFLALAPKAQPLCGFVGAMVSVNDFADRAARGLQDGETVSTGAKLFRFIRTPHLPHNWEAGHLFEESTGTLFCSDLFHQDGEVEPVITSEPELIGRARDTLVRYQKGPFSNYLPFTPETEKHIGRLADLRPNVLGVMHGSAYSGNGEHALRELSKIFSGLLGK
jgi:flavorubredoxin